MNIILLEDVGNVGVTGDLVSVKPGYARNYLIPRNKAAVASSQNRKQLEHAQRLANHRMLKQKAGHEILAGKIQGLEILLSRRVGENDKMFGSVTAKDIVEALQAQGLDVDRRKIALPQPIKTLGEFSLVAKLHPGVSAEFKLTVQAEA
jgi:large subunit ribosomal protein L9